VSELESERIETATWHVTDERSEEAA